MNHSTWRTRRARQLAGETVGYDQEYVDARLAGDLGQAVYDRRIELGLSQAELAERAGMTQPQVSRMEGGDTVPTLPLLRRLEVVIRPRWPTPFEATKRVVGLVVLLLAATLVWPFPFSHIIPALVIMLLALAYLEEDGVLLALGLAAAVVSLAITGATVWAGIRVTDWLAPRFGA